MLMFASPHTRLQNVGWHSLYVLGVFFKKTYTCPVCEVVNTLPFHGRGASSILARDANSSLIYIGKHAGPEFDPRHVHTQTDNTSHMGVYLALTAYEVRYTESYLML